MSSKSAPFRQIGKAEKDGRRAAEKERRREGEKERRRAE